VAQSAKEISLSSQQQTSGSEEISKAMTGIDEIMRQSASGAKQSAASARELSQLAEELKTTIAQFKIGSSETENPVPGEAPPAQEKDPPPAEEIQKVYLEPVMAS
jgi:methyl-accepting chemotaxis protein